MLDVHCTACSRRQLLPVSRVVGIVNDENGIHVVYTCTCGEVGVWDTGRAAEKVPAAA